MTSKFYLQRAAGIGVLCALVGLGGCGKSGQSDAEKKSGVDRAAASETIKTACVRNTAHDAAFCDCYAEKLAGALNDKNLSRYVEVLEHSLAAFSSRDESVQRENLEAMSENMEDTGFMLRVAGATGKAMKACGKSPS